jgi:hypothetical protein
MEVAYFPSNPPFGGQSVHVLAAAASAAFKSRAALQLENLALRHQLGVLHRSVKGPRLTAADRLLWAWLSEIWADWRLTLCIVKPETVIAWHKKGFRLFWTWKIRLGKPGRPAVPKEVRDLIRRLCLDNPLWGAPRVHGELLKLGIDIGETSVGKYMLRRRKPPSQTWRTFLENYVTTMVSIDVFTVPTVRFQVLYSDRYPSPQLSRLDHVVVFNEASLYRHVKSFVAYYHESRTHLSLAKDAPESRPIQGPEVGPIVAIPQLGGLHHRYVRRAA